MPTFIATTQQGLEPVLAKELTQLGLNINEPLLKRAVSFEADNAGLYRANLSLRTALHILKPIANFSADDAQKLYRQAMQFDWRSLMRAGDTFAIYPVVKSPYFRHSQYAALCLKDAIADRFKQEIGRRPSVDTNNPDFRIYLRIHNDDCTILLDSSGESLHKRSYRSESNEAPLNEVLAAGMLSLSEWHGQTDLADVFCGSGTLLIEAALLARNMSPNQHRLHFGFHKWPDFDDLTFRRVKQQALDAQRPFDHLIYGSDISSSSVHIAQRNARRAGVADSIRFKTAAFEHTLPPTPATTLIMNPPYGERMQIDDLSDLYARLGSCLKHNYSGCQAWVLSGNKEMMHQIGLKPRKKYNLLNGAIDCVFYGYDLYEGSKKDRYTQEIIPEENNL